MPLTLEQIKEMDAIAGVKTPTPLVAPQSENIGLKRAQEIEERAKTANLKNRSGYEKFSDALGDFSSGAVKGAISTVKGAGELGTKALDSIYGKRNGGSDLYRPETEAGQKAEEFLAPKNTAESIGKGTEQIGEFFIPAGKIAQVEKFLAGGVKTATLAKLTPIVGEKAAKVISNALSVGTKMGVRAGEGGGIVAVQSGGDAKETGIAAGISAAIPLASSVGKPVIKAATDIIGGTTKRLAGALSGQGTAVIDEIIKDPKSALEGLSGKSMDILSKDAQTLKESAVNMKTEAGKEYNRVLNNLQSIYENEGKSFDKGTEINKVLDLLDEKFGIKTAGKVGEQTGEEVLDKGVLDFESSRFIKPSDTGIINRALTALKSFRDPLSPKTLEGLASKIDKLKGSDSEVNSVLHTITSSLRESVAKMGEEVGYGEGADIARNYAKAMDKLDNFTSLFKATGENVGKEGIEVSKVGEPRIGKEIVLTETEKTKIINDLQTLFKGNKDVDKEVLRKMFGGQELLSREAGRSIAVAPEKASSKLEDFIKSMINSVISPKQIGKIAAQLSMKSQQVPKFMSILKKLDPLVQGSLIKYLSEKNNPD